MQTLHTPGPWKFSFESIDPAWAIVTSKNGFVVANVNANVNSNAGLIAAAPDLLEALEKIADFTTGYDDVAGIVCGIARAAIAKAAL